MGSHLGLGPHRYGDATPGRDLFVWSGLVGVRIGTKAAHIGGGASFCPYQMGQANHIAEATKLHKRMTDQLALIPLPAPPSATECTGTKRLPMPPPLAQQQARGVFAKSFGCEGTGTRDATFVWLPLLMPARPLPLPSQAKAQGSRAGAHAFASNGWRRRRQRH